MTFTIKTQKIGHYAIEIYQVKFECTYHVGWYWSPNNDIYRTLDDRTYTNLQSANRRFRTLVKRCEEE